MAPATDNLLQQIATIPFTPISAKGIEGIDRIAHLDSSYPIALFFMVTLTLIYCLINTQFLYSFKQSQTQKDSLSLYYYLIASLVIIIGLIQLSLSIWLTTDHLTLEEIAYHTDRIGLIALYIIGYILLRNSLELLIGSLYLQTSLLLSSIYLRLRCLLVTSLLLYPIPLASFYHYKLSQESLFWLLIILYIAMILYHAIRSCFQFSLQKNQLFYIILYLCTLDFLPLVIMLKLIALY